MFCGRHVGGHGPHSRRSPEETSELPPAPQARYLVLPVSRPSHLEREILCSGIWNAELQRRVQLPVQAPAVQVDAGDQQLLNCL